MNNDDIGINSFNYILVLLYFKDKIELKYYENVLDQILDVYDNKNPIIKHWKYLYLTKKNNFIVFYHNLKIFNPENLQNADDLYFQVINYFEYYFVDRKANFLKFINILMDSEFPEILLSNNHCNYLKKSYKLSDYVKNKLNKIKKIRESKPIKKGIIKYKPNNDKKIAGSSLKDFIFANDEVLSISDESISNISIPNFKGFDRFIDFEGFNDFEDFEGFEEYKYLRGIGDISNFDFLLLFVKKLLYFSENYLLNKEISPDNKSLSSSDQSRPINEKDILPNKENIISSNKKSESFDKDYSLNEKSSLCIEKFIKNFENNLLNINYTIDIDYPNNIETNPNNIETNTFNIESNPFSIETSSINSDINPIDAETNSINVENNPIILENNLINAETNSINAETDSTNTENGPNMLDNNPINTETNPIMLENNPINPENNPIMLDNNPINTEANPINTEMNPINAEPNPNNEIYVYTIDSDEDIDMFNGSELTDDIKFTINEYDDINNNSNDTNNFEYDISEDWKFKIYTLNFPPEFAVCTKAIIKFYDMNFKLEESLIFETMCELDGYPDEFLFDFSIFYSLPEFLESEIFIIISYISVIKINNNTYDKPYTWGFSIFDLNKPNSFTKIKMGYFKWPIYFPYYLNFDRWKFKRYFEENKFERYYNSYLIVRNKPINSIIDINFIEYKFKSKNIEKKDRKILKKLKRNHIEKFLCDTELDWDIFLNSAKSTILKRTNMYDNWKNWKNIKLNVNLLFFNEILNPNVVIKAFLLNFRDNLYHYSQCHYFINFSSFSCKNKIIFNEKWKKFNILNREMDIILFEIFTKIDSSKDHNINNLNLIGHTIFPLYKYKIIYGDYIWPIVKGEFGLEELKSIKQSNPFDYWISLTKNLYYNYLFISTVNPMFKHTDKILPNIILEKYNYMFISNKIKKIILKFIEIYIEKLIYNNLKKKDNFNNNINYYFESEYEKVKKMKLRLWNEGMLNVTEIENGKEVLIKKSKKN